MTIFGRKNKTQLTSPLPTPADDPYTGAPNTPYSQAVTPGTALVGPDLNHEVTGTNVTSNEVGQAKVAIADQLDSAHLEGTVAPAVPMDKATAGLSNGQNVTTSPLNPASTVATEDNLAKDALSDMHQQTATADSGQSLGNVTDVLKDNPAANPLNGSLDRVATETDHLTVNPSIQGESELADNVIKQDGPAIKGVSSSSLHGFPPIASPEGSSSSNLTKDMLTGLHQVGSTSTQEPSIPISGPNAKESTISTVNQANSIIAGANQETSFNFNEPYHGAPGSASGSPAAPTSISQQEYSQMSDITKGYDKAVKLDSAVASGNQETSFNFNEPYHGAQASSLSESSSSTPVNQQTSPHTSPAGGLTASAIASENSSVAQGNQESSFNFNQPYHVAPGSATPLDSSLVSKGNQETSFNFNGPYHGAPGSAASPSSAESGSTPSSGTSSSSSSTSSSTTTVTSPTTSFDHPNVPLPPIDEPPAPAKLTVKDLPSHSTVHEPVGTPAANGTAKVVSSAFPTSSDYTVKPANQSVTPMAKATNSFEAQAEHSSSMSGWAGGPGTTSSAIGGIEAPSKPSVESNPAKIKGITEVI